MKETNTWKTNHLVIGSPASRFCAITGGEYSTTANQGTPDETGTCAFKNGKTCDAIELYKGECRPGE